MRKSKLLVYATSNRRGMETQIASDILPFFTTHLDKIGDVDKISLLIYTRGGDTLTAWSLVNLIRSFCKDFEVIVPFYCHSAGTLICLGANRIVMTKQATIGPIDPSVNNFFNPQLQPGNPGTAVPISVEFINGYLDMIKNQLGIVEQESLTKILINLADKIHPMVLGQVYKSKTQIQMLAKKLIANQQLGEEKEEKIIKFLVSESGSHDYTINRKEAKDELGLNIEKPDDSLYEIINNIYLDIQKELQLMEPFEPQIILANTNTFTYSFRRAIIESIKSKCDVFINEGMLMKQSNPNNPLQSVIQDNRQFEGWKHER